MNHDLVQAYRYQRARDIAAPHRAKGALIDARRDVAAGVKRHAPPVRPFASAGAPFQRGLRWIEQAPRNGFRFVAYADELLGSIRHQGWFLEDDGLSGEVARGAVYQVTGVEGGARYVAGVADPMGNDGAAAIDFSRVYLGEPAGYAQDARHDQGATEAAHAADECARIYAEKERDYNRESAARIRHDDLKEQIKALMIERRAMLVGAVSMARTAGVAATIGARQERIRDDVTQAYRERAQLRLDYDHTEGWKNAA